MERQDLSGPHQDWQRENVLQTIYGFELWAPEDGNRPGNGTVYLRGHDENGPWHATLRTRERTTYVGYQGTNGPELGFWMNNHSLEGLHHRLAGNPNRKGNPDGLRVPCPTVDWPEDH
jgi:hypothetical protein